MKKIAMMTALVVGCLCVGAAMAEPEQKKPAPKGPRMERRNNPENAKKRAEMAATRFGGKVVAKDGATVTVKNRAEKEMTFTAKTEEAKKMLEGVAVDDFVGVRFTKAGEGFALDAIRKFEGPRQGRPEGAPGERRMRQGDGAKDKPAGEAKRVRKQDGEGKAKVEGEKKADCADCPKAKEKGKDKPKAE